MAILKCQHCEYSKEVSEQYAEKTVKCPSCGQAAKVYDTIALLAAFSEKMSEFQVELDELRQTVANQPAPAVQASEELTQALGKIFREHRIAMTEFNDATKRRDAITLRAERRTLNLARFGMAGFFILLIILMFFVFQFADNARTVSEQVFTIADRMKMITNDLDSLKQGLTKLNMGMQTNSVNPEIASSVNDIHSAMGSVQNKIREINNNVVQLMERVENKDDAARYRQYR